MTAIINKMSQSACGCANCTLGNIGEKETLAHMILYCSTVYQAKELQGILGNLKTWTMEEQKIHCALLIH